MQAITLHWNRAKQMVLLIITLCMLGTTNSYARIYDPDWSEECPTGQTLWYSVIDSDNHYVALTHPHPNATLNWLNYSTGLWEYPTGDITLPAYVTHNGITYTLTEIDQHTFHNCSGLTGTLTIPNTVTRIRENAFSYCSGFSSLIISSSVTVIEKSAFSNCSGCSGTLYIPANVTQIGASAFEYCSGFDSLTLSEGLNTISNSAFQYCSGFKGSLIIPNTVTSIGQWAFAYCSGFDGELKLSDNITLVPQYGFKGCIGFCGDLVIPSKVTKISNEAFYNCSQFSAIYLCPGSVVKKGTENSSFVGVPKTIPVYVPYCLVEDYISQWSVFNFTNYQGRSFFNTSGNWSNQNNWACGTVPTDGMNVVIAADCNLNASVDLPSFTILKYHSLSIMPEMVLNCNTITNKGNAENLIIQEGGQLYHNNEDVQATVMKSITPYTEGQNDGWHLISSPLVGNIDMSSVENLLSNQYDLFYYDEPTAYWRNQENSENNFTQLSSGTGYLYANNQEVSLQFAGSLVSGSSSVTLPLSYTETSDLEGFNLVGNPYAHNVTSYGTQHVAEQGCYRMNEAKTELIVSEITENSPLKPAESFFVLATGQDASITFNSAKTRDEVKRTGSIYLELCENGQITDRLIVKRSEEDRDFAKLSLRDSGTKLFALKDKQELAIVVCNEDEQAVNFKTKKNGTYTINVTINDIEADYLHLIDNLTGNNIDLLATPSYSFDARITDYASRFRLVFEPNAGEDVSNESFAYISNGAFIIANEGVATLQIVDITGRILSSETIYDNFTKPINLSDGVYVLRLINGDNVKAQKIVVQ